MLIVKSCQQGFLSHELFDCFVVVPNPGLFSCQFMLEDEEPVKGKHLTVKDKEVIQSLHLPIVGPLLVRLQERSSSGF